MGDPSTLVYVPPSSATVPIDWSKVPEESKKFLMDRWPTDWYAEDDEDDNDENDEDEDEEEEEPKYKEPKIRPIPATIGDLANFFNHSKFFGYMQPKLCKLLLEISEFGLAGSHDLPVGPRFYMKAYSEVWVLLFMPGQRDGFCARSPAIPFDEDKDWGDMTEEKKLAEEFDKKLEGEIKAWGSLKASTLHDLAGWHADGLVACLEEGQLGEAMLSLPMGHSAKRAYFQSMFSSLR